METGQAVHSTSRCWTEGGCNMGTDGMLRLATGRTPNAHTPVR